MKKKRIVFINQRYGLEVNGGSEQYTREFAEHLTDRYEVEVLTTCALDYITWEDHYTPGVEMLNGVLVRRFRVDRPRDPQRFGDVSARMFGAEYTNRATEEEWVDEQGPMCSALLEYIKKHHEKYDVLIFVTYLYYLTVRGIGMVRNKAILIPTAHDEPYIKLGIYKDVFLAPRAYGFNAPEERDYVYSLFHTQYIENEILGIGVTLPENIDSRRFKEKYGVGEYLLYTGRIDEGKNCGQLFLYFLEFKKRNPQSALKLVLMGKAVMDVPQHPDILMLGFVSEQDKYDGMAGAKMLVLPSKFESLSMVVLESLAVGVPVVVNGECEVLKGHCLRSNAGLYYGSYFEFEGAIHYLLSHPETYADMADNGKKYITENYEWDVVSSKLIRLIEAPASKYSPDL